MIMQYKDYDHFGHIVLRGLLWIEAGLLVIALLDRVT